MLVLTIPTEEWLEVIRTVHSLVLRWFTFAVLIIFALGILFSFTARAQAPTSYSNSADIANMDGKLKVLENKVNNLGDLNIQFQSMRDRIVGIESRQRETGEKVDEIYGAKNWLIFAVFGILINEAMKRLKFRGPTD